MNTDQLEIPPATTLDGRRRLVIIKYERFGVPSSLTTGSDDTARCTRSVAWTNHPGDGTAFISRVGPIIGAVLDFFFAVMLAIGRKG